MILVRILVILAGRDDVILVTINRPGVVMSRMWLWLQSGADSWRNC